MAEAEKARRDVTFVAEEEIEKFVEKVMAVTPKARQELDFLMVKN